MEQISRYSLETFNVVWWSVIGILIFSFGSWLIDKLDPIDYRKQIESGNVAAAIKFSAMLLGLAGIIIMAIR
jgi:uncharacterized membrane protein YjfL (UPF0719 family)